MYFDKKIINNFLPLFIFTIFFLIGLSSFQDFGISSDESFHRDSGNLYYEFLKGIFFSDSGSAISLKQMQKLASEDVLYMMPAIFDMINEFIIDIFNIKDIQKIFFLRHFINFFIFLIGCYYFFLIILKIFDSYLYSYIGILSLFCYPRIFGESFYNNKDLVFLSVCIILIYYSIQFLTKLTFKNALIFGIFSALAFDVRIMSIIIIFVSYFLLALKILDNNNFFSNKYKYVLTSSAVTILFIFIFWPYLWLDPINNLINFLTKIKSVTPEIHNYYMGEYIYSKNVPWHFDIVWILVTIPTTVAVFFVIGFLNILLKTSRNFLNLEKKGHKFIESNNDLYNLYFFLIFLLVLLSQIKFGVSYDGWRHLYFLYPIIIIFFLRGIFLIQFNLSNKNIIKFFYIIVSFEIMFLIFWSFKNHPHQYVFFNPLYKNFTLKKFELDYWGLSNRSSLEYIIRYSKKDIIKVAAISWTSLDNSLLILKKSKKDKIKVVHDLREADFVIDNYRKKWDKKIDYTILNEKYKKIFDLVIDERIINTIYERKI